MARTSSALASLTNLDRLPPTGAVIVTAPLKIKGGSGSPPRVLALVEGMTDFGRRQRRQPARKSTKRQQGRRKMTEGIAPGAACWRRGQRQPLRHRRRRGANRAKGAGRLSRCLGCPPHRDHRPDTNPPPWHAGDPAALPPPRANAPVQPRGDQPLRRPRPRLVLRNNFSTRRAHAVRISTRRSARITGAGICPTGPPTPCRPHA